MVSNQTNFIDKTCLSLPLPMCLVSIIGTVYLHNVFSLHTIIIQGFGTLLMEEAERVAMEEHGSSKIAVISGGFFFQNDIIMFKGTVIRIKIMFQSHIVFILNSLM